MYKFIHTSDWHLGKPFGQFEDDLRGRLREARHSITGGSPSHCSVVLGYHTPAAQRGQNPLLYILCGLRKGACYGRQQGALSLAQILKSGRAQLEVSARQNIMD